MQEELQEATLTQFDNLGYRTGHRQSGEAA